MELTGKVRGPFFQCRLKMFDAGLEGSMWLEEASSGSQLLQDGVSQRRVAGSRIFKKCLILCFLQEKTTTSRLFFKRRSDKQSGLSLNLMTSLTSAGWAVCCASGSREEHRDWRVCCWASTEVC